jgi:hypothetical protein
MKMAGLATRREAELVEAVETVRSELCHLAIKIEAYAVGQDGQKGAQSSLFLPSLLFPCWHT